MFLYICTHGDKEARNACGGPSIQSLLGRFLSWQGFIKVSKENMFWSSVFVPVALFAAVTKLVLYVTLMPDGSE
jgi:hypothetical protein